MEHAYCLNVHASYGCRHSGACCTAGWAIPVEGSIYETLTVHFGAHVDREPVFATGGPLPEGAAAILGTRAGGACVFFDPERGRLCRVHRELGPAMLPLACRQFPRIVLQDARGTLISLSSFCPTVASLLLSGTAPEIIRAPRPLALDGDLDGLDARDALPPLLAPDMLTDDEGYAAWERRAIDTLARHGSSADAAIATIAAVTRTVQSWKPGGATLRDTVERAFDVAAAPDSRDDLDDDERLMRLAVASVPKGLSAPVVLDDYRDRSKAVARWWQEADHVVRAYLAARLFGNWIAYYGRGLHAVVEYLRTSQAVLKMEAARHAADPDTPWQSVLEPALRNADLLLVHLSDAKHLAQRLS
jgi:hypothetical protein